MSDQLREPFISGPDNSNLKGKIAEVKLTPLKSLKETLENIEREDAHLKGHKSSVKCLMVDKMEEFLVSGSDDNLLKVWNLKEKTEDFSLSGHLSPITSVDISLDRKLISSGSKNGFLIIWNFNNRNQIYKYENTQAICSVAFCPGDILTFSGNDSKIKVWNYISNTIIKTLDNCQGNATVLKFTSDWKTLISGSSDGKIRLWNFIDFSCIKCFDHDTKVSEISLSSNGSQMASCSSKGIIKVWNFNEDQAVLNLDSKQFVASVEFNKKGTEIIAGYKDGTIFSWNLAKSKPALIAKIDCKVTALRYLNNEKFIVYSSKDTIIKLHNMDEFREFKSFNTSVTSVDYNSNLNLLFTAHNNGSVLLWDYSTFTLKKQIEPSNFYILDLKVAKDGKKLIIIDNKKNVVLWDIVNDRNLKTMKYTEYCSQIDLGANDTVIACPSQKGIIIKSLDISGQQQDDILFTNNPTSFIKFSNSSKYLIGAYLKYVTVWDYNERREVTTFYGHSNNITCIAISGDENFIATGSCDTFIKLWNLKTHKEEFTYMGHLHNINCLSFSPNNKFIISGSYDSQLKLWSIFEKSELVTFKGHTNSINCIGYFDMNYIISSSKGEMKVWDLQDKGSKYKFEAHSGWIRTVVISPDSKYLLTASSDKTIKLWDFSLKKLIYTFQGNTHGVECADFHPSGNLIVSGGRDNLVKVWDIDKKCVIKTYEGHSGDVMRVLFSPDGKYIASGSYDATIKIWSFDQDNEEFTFNGHSGKVTWIEYTPDGTHILSSSEDKTIKVWDVTAKKIKFTLLGHQNCVQKVRPSPCGNIIASSSADLTIRIWSFNERIELFKFTGHADTIWWISFSPSGKYIASCSLDQEIKVWNLLERRQEFAFNGHTNMILSVLFTPDERKIISGSADKSIWIWDFPKPNSLEVLSLPFIDSQYFKSKIPEPFRKSSLIDFGYQSKLEYLATISKLKKKSYDSLTTKSINIFIGEYSFTPLHILAYLGVFNNIRKLMQNEGFTLHADSFGHSPIYYSIKTNHQKCTDLLLEFLYNIASNDRQSMQYLTSLNAIRNDILLIIANSSKMLHLFMSILVYPENESVQFGKSYSSLPMISFSNLMKSNEDSFFLKLGNSETIEASSRDDNVPLIMKNCSYRLPSVLGSNDSIQFIKEIVNCKNEEIFRTELVQYYILYGWLELKWWVYFYTFLTWVDIILLVLILYLNSLEVICAFIVVNILLFIWEIMQMIQEKGEYFDDLWNLTDLFRFLTTCIWIVYSFLYDQNVFLLYSAVFLHIIRGLSGFRAFDATRYYIKLILESLKEIRFFFIIYIYSTLAFGFLSTTSTLSFINSSDVWIHPFALTVGETDGMIDTKLSLRYLTFALAIIINIILMLNMIISILGDSFDEFQIKSEIFNFKEIADFLLEINNIKSLFCSTSSFNYIHVCCDPNIDKSETWNGKIIHLKYHIDNLKSHIEINTSKTTEVICKKIQVLSESINKDVATAENNVIQKIDMKFKALENIVQKKMDELQQRIDNLGYSLQKDNPL
ncbi:hypothetical protein SteCoe_37360 [Stentor coeruleus]|uniref:Ion transport domain-containing protein n=1 Tax=Stentor coeruleus TaxID=5963 RepID=A0A1R2ANA2_9CILI|nr:hypothetical protein SteCoe_37360 [Stentor coeruleus]